MSDPTYVVMSIRPDGPSQTQQDEVATAIEDSLHKRLHSGQDAEPAEKGPLKKVMANSDSLYKYISWEDPVRSLASYFALLGLLYGVHYLHCTQLLLKMGATSLGVVSFTSLISRSTKNDFITRMRPDYKEVPESTLNATLKDIHDLVQYLVLEAQKIIYGEDLRKTFGAFVSVTTLFWLIKILSPFNLEVLGLSSAYVIPLLFSVSSREIAKDAKLHAQELAQTAAESAGSAVRDGRDKAVDLSNKTQQAAGDMTSKTQNAASNKLSDVQQTAGDLTSKTQQAVSDMSSTGQQAAGNLASKTQQTTSKLASDTQSVAGTSQAKTQETASNLATSAKQVTENITPKTQQTTSNPTPETSRFAGVFSSKPKQPATNMPSNLQTITGNQSVLNKIP